MAGFTLTGSVAGATDNGFITIKAEAVIKLVEAGAKKLVDESIRSILPCTALMTITTISKDSKLIYQVTLAKMQR